MKTIGAVTILVAAVGLGAFGGYRLAATPGQAGTALSWHMAGSNAASPTAPAPPDFRQAAKRIMPSVVSVDRLERIQDFWTDQVSVTPTATGSGVIVSSDGYILTNNHVVEQADSVQVRLADQRQFQAKVVGTDPRSDIAVIKIDAPNLVPAEIGSSSKLEVGEWVLAVGNPLGYANTVSAGVVSSLKRTLSTNENALLIDTIQTDAAINQGNSGGALADAQGRLVGINSAIATQNGGSVGIGFAIPIDRARRVADEIVKYGRARYGELGVEIFARPGLLQSDTVRQEISERVGAMPPSTGVIVRQVDPGSAASQAGIEPLDVLLEIDGKSLPDPFSYMIAMADKRPNEHVQIAYWSKGKRKTAEVVLQDQ
jgi:S1-C subfamily serine protease